MNEIRKAKNSIDMINGPVFGKILKFAVPLMLSTVLQILFNAADVIVVGRFAGDVSLAAVGATTAIVNLIVNLFLGLAIGTNVLVAHNIGAGRSDEVHDAVHTAVKAGIYIGILMTVIGLLFSTQLLRLMAAPDEIIGLSSLYLRIIFFGTPALMLYNVGSAILRAVGDTKRPLIYLSTAGVLNVLLNMFFVIVVKMDVAGVALSTILTQYLSAFLTIRCLVREDSVIRLIPKDMKIKKDVLWKMIRIGLPAGIQGCLFSISNVVVQSYINSFGATVVAANAAALNLEYTLFAISNAFSSAVMSFMSQNIGAGKIERVRRIYISGMISSLIFVVSVSTLMCIFGESILSLFTNSQAVVDAGMKRVLICEMLYFIYGLFDINVGALRGMGYSLMPMIASIGGICALRIVYLAVMFSIPGFHTETVLYSAYPISWGVTFLILLVCYLIIVRRMKKRLSPA